MGSFNDYAYVLPERGANSKPITTPLAPWKVTSEIPDEFYNFNIPYSVSLTRSMDGYTEVWVSKYEHPYYYFGQDKPHYKFMIYRTDTGEWKTISAEIGDSGMEVDQLYLTSDSAIWGHVVWDDSFTPSTSSPLARFDEPSNKFELVSEVKDVPSFWRDSIPNTSNYPVWSVIVLDRKNRFWIFASKDAIYSYDPASRTVVRHASLADAIINEAVFDSMKYIYAIQHKENWSGFIQDYQFLKFDIITGQLETLNYPWHPWPVSSSLLVDRNDHLWVGATGWRTSSGQWHMIYPWSAMLSGYGYIHWPSGPTIFLESSDGRLWFKRMINENDNWGMAWLDPETMKGCWFTSAYTGILEDQNHVLWMAAYGSLYKYEIAK